MPSSQRSTWTVGAAATAAAAFARAWAAHWPWAIPTAKMYRRGHPLERVSVLEKSEAVTDPREPPARAVWCPYT
jgi:cobalamin biosynthesis protein CbiD